MRLKPSVIKSVFSKAVFKSRYLFKADEQNKVPTLYWENRAKQYGRRSVLNLGHSDEEFDEVTRKQKDEIYRHFISSLRSDEKLVLDLGCGPGRFTADLAGLIKGRAVGIDITEELLKMAPVSENVEYKTMREGHIPLPDAYVDIVWVCLVLGGIKGDVLINTINEIKRVLKNDGLLFLIENTDQGLNSKNWISRGVDQYIHLFSSVSLKHLHDYRDLGERISIMSGRKRP